MRVIEHDGIPDEHFTEGEPDLEAPEELALAELDDEQMLEEDLDNEDVAEEEVDETTLEVTLEHLVHKSDGDEGDDDSGDGPAPSWTLTVSESAELVVPKRGARRSHVSRNGDDEVALDTESDTDEIELEVVDLEDLEESLDRILSLRLAADRDSMDEPDEPADVEGAGPSPIAIHFVQEHGSTMSSCQGDEFVCRSCFLVLKRAQLAEPTLGICRDCSN